MRKFKSVLSEGEAATTAEEIGFFDGSDELFLLFAHKLEQAVLAKLHEQEPVVYRFLPPGTQQYMYITDNVPKIKEFEPLYSHPIPATEQEPFAWFINDKRVCGNRIITDPAVARDWLDTDPDKVTPLYTHPCQINSLADGTVIDEGTKEHHRTTKNHIPDASKMVKSLRDEFAMAALTGLLSNSGGPVQASSQSGWSLVNCTLDDVSSFAYEMADAMLEAAPKYTQADHIPDTGKMIVPEGWQLVPVEPTQEMVQAADKSDEEYSKRNFNADVGLCQSGYDHYITMLEAAPKYTEAQND